VNPSSSSSSSKLDTFSFVLPFPLSSLPQTSLHILDCFFNEGPSVLFSTALSVFKLNEQAILFTQTPEEVITLLKNKQHFFEELLQVLPYTSLYFLRTSYSSFFFFFLFFLLLKMTS
jgi:hypothetical protein